MTRVRILGLVVAAGVLLSGLLAACGSPTARPSAGADVRRHADVAGTVMSRNRGPVPAGAVAAAVVGTKDDTTIAALTAAGSTWGGTVVLRITVDRGSGTVADVDRASRCFVFRFRFPRTGDDGRPHGAACPAGAPLRLSAAAYPVGVDSSTRIAVTAAVGHLSAADRTVASRVTAALRTAVGRYFVVSAGVLAPGVFAWVRYGETCLTVQTSARSLQVSAPRQGNDCFGG